MAKAPPASSAAEGTATAKRSHRPATSGRTTGHVCGYTFDGKTCRKRKANHYCEPRADRVVAFFAEILVHTKSDWARRAFTLEDWQEHEIIRPLFGTVRWSDEWGRYVRQYTIAWIEIARKNGKSELAAGIALYLLIGDDEESAEVYGAAKDTKQARKVWDVAERMRQLSPVLSKRLGCNKHEKRIYDVRTASYYETVTRDALGELGANPHGVVFDEIISQPDGSLWEALRTAMGTRAQPLMVALTTSGNDPTSFAALMHHEMVLVAADPARAPHVFTFIRNTPDDVDVFDEANWAHANPALGSFLSYQSLRDEATEARNQPARENSFRQFRCNQWVSQATRYIPIHLWDANAGEVWTTRDYRLDNLVGKRCTAGLDLSAKLDLTAWCLLFDDNTAWWRFWLPEEALAELDRHLAGQLSVWADDGWLTVTEGNVIDYDRVYDDIVEDHARFGIAGIAYDPWSTDPVVQEIQKRTGLEMRPVTQTFAGISTAMTETMSMLVDTKLRHLANPVARWHADSLEARTARDNPDLVRPVKPERQNSGKRIDGMPALFMAVDERLARSTRQQDSGPVTAAAGNVEGRSIYESSPLNL